MCVCVSVCIYMFYINMLSYYSSIHQYYNMLIRTCIRMAYISSSSIFQRVDTYIYFIGILKIISNFHSL